MRLAGLDSYLEPEPLAIFDEDKWYVDSDSGRYLIKRRPHLKVCENPDTLASLSIEDVITKFNESKSLREGEFSYSNCVKEGILENFQSFGLNFQDFIDGGASFTKLNITSGFDFEEFDFSNISFENCFISSTSFSEAKFQNTKFVDCSLPPELFYQSSNLTNANFENITLQIYDGDELQEFLEYDFENGFSLDDTPVSHEFKVFNDENGMAHEILEVWID